MIWGSLRFAGDLSPWIVFTVAVAAAVLVALLYLRETRHIDSPLNFVLPALRAATVAMIILILAGPVWHRRITVGTLGRIVFAVDATQSMSVTDTQSDDAQTSRVARAMRMLAGDSENEGWIESLRATHDIDVVAFSAGEPVTVWTSGDAGDQETDRTDSLLIQPDGKRTELASAVTALAFQSEDDADATPVQSALVVISDGRDNVGGSAIDMAGTLRASGAMVHTIGMGSEDEPADVSIAEVSRPDSVAADAVLGGSIAINQFGFDGRDLNVRIESAETGKTVWQTSVAATGTFQSVPFELDVETVIDQTAATDPRGVRRSTIVMDLRAVVEPIDGESISTNNTMAFRVAASTRDRRLLIMDGSSRWETRYVRNLFERDPAWTVDTILFGPGTDTLRLERGDDDGEFPRSRESLAKYDVIILGEVPPDQFEITDANLIREFVTRGGGLVVVDGRYDRIKKIAQSSLRDLIPVEFGNDRLLAASSMIPTRLGMENPMLNLGGEKTDLQNFWSQLPAPQSFVRVDRQEGAEAWVDAVDADGERSPWLVTRLFGSGRVFYLSSDQTWRWRYKVADRFHARFWNQLLAASMQPPYSANDEYVAIGTDKIEYRDGEAAIIRVRLQDTGGKPVGDATVDALVVSENQIIASVPMSVDDPARGTYTGLSPKLNSGAYEVRVRASGFDSTALQASTPIWVGDRHSVEMNRVSLDRGAMEQLAAAGGGVYVHESSASKILDSLRPLSSGTIVESDVVVWQSFYWFWAVIILLAAEWVLRKRAGLV
ncbi:hypothetical protein Poly51_57430 [Rubripirellula tenax]|uniref:VWFA domain-containing protein n=1 Tax=Rubripirellula tenax TaxID=2528015 RepID=A0A5C6EEC5_9BACT|nr:VWA domain-containing protein [Rubripirellula tenax]TWU46347.1 hypothetical protein Poly51_57430 [Rubripirellula tenax]